MLPTRNELKARILEEDFREFVTYFFWVLNGLRFKWNDHHHEIVDALMECYHHRVSRLVINIPPRYGKTELVVVMFIAWCLAKYPNAQFIHLSYSDPLVDDNSARVREIILSEEYQELWPHIKIKPDQSSKRLWRTEQRGGLKASPTRGSVTGFGAGIAYDIPDGGSPEDVPFGGAIIIDDPMKPEDAESEAERKRVNRMMNNTVRSRANAPWTPIIMIMQRVHDDDPTGFVLAGGMGDDWTHLKIPVVRPNGEPLWTFRHDKKDLVAIQVSDKNVWNGQYMQEPLPDDGDFFLKDKVNWYKNLPEHLEYYGSSDYAASDDSGADWTVHLVWGICPAGRIYLVDGWRGQTKTDVWVDEQLDLVQTYHPQLWGGETGPIKAAVEPWLRKRMDKRRAYVPLRWVNHSTTNYKIANARSFQALWEQGLIYFPKDSDLADWVLSQLVRFPKGTLDDGVDACSIFARMIHKVWEANPPEDDEEGPNISKVELRIDEMVPIETEEW